MLKDYQETIYALGVGFFFLFLFLVISAPSNMHLSGMKPYLGEKYTALELRHRFVKSFYIQAIHNFPFAHIYKSNIAFLINC